MSKKVIVFGATGRVGKAVCLQAKAQGWEVTAFVRKADAFTIPDIEVIEGDVMVADSVIKALGGGFNAVLSAIGPRTVHAKIRTSSVGMVSITKGMAAHNINRIVSVGGSGILQYNDSRLVQDLQGFPPQLKTISDEHHKAWNTLVKSGLVFTLICPGYMPTGEVTGQYRTQLNTIMLDTTQILTDDVAHFMVNQIDNPAYYSQRIAIGY
jgi:putative NADH-flavin reductase